MKTEIIIASAVAVVIGGAVFSVNQRNNVPDFHGSYTDLIANSEDVGRYESQFTQAARHLIAKDICTPNDFIQWGGFDRAPEGRPNYFTYCRERSKRGLTGFYNTSTNERIQFNVRTMDYQSPLFWGNAAQAN